MGLVEKVARTNSGGGISTTKAEELLKQAKKAGESETDPEQATDTENETDPQEATETVVKQYEWGIEFKKVSKEEADELRSLRWKERKARQSAEPRGVKRDSSYLDDDQSVKSARLDERFALPGATELYLKEHRKMNPGSKKSDALILDSAQLIYIREGIYAKDYDTKVSVVVKPTPDICSLCMELHNRGELRYLTGTDPKTFKFVAVQKFGWYAILMQEKVMRCYYSIDSTWTSFTGVCTSQSPEEISFADQLIVERRKWQHMPSDTQRMYDWEELPVLKVGLHLVIDGGEDEVELLPQPDHRLLVVQSLGLFRQCAPLFRLPEDVTWEQRRQ